MLIRTIQNTRSGEIYAGIGNLTNQIIDGIGGTLEIKKLYKLDKNIFNKKSTGIKFTFKRY